LWQTSDAEKPMEACASCMEPASVVVVLVGCASSASGMATPRQSRLMRLFGEVAQSVM
jgi:hypothetical protein